MYIIRGIRKARIRTYQLHTHRCDNCRDFNITIKIYKEYYHVFFIPIAATGVKSSSIYCNSCGMLIRSDSLSKEFETKTRVPFYLSAGLIAVSLFLLFLVGTSICGKIERQRFIDDPKSGDVYLMKTDSAEVDGHYFIRLAETTGDSAKAYANHLIYIFSTSEFSAEDYFDSDREVSYSKARLKEMYEKGKIESVYRDYAKETGFDRVRASSDDH